MQRWPTTWLLNLGLLSALAGCRSSELVEAELRSRERQLEELRAELHRTEDHNHCLERELCDLRRSSSAKVVPDSGGQTSHVTSVVLSRLTGGYDDDRCPGDEALQVVLEPRDPDGHSVKASGCLHVTALEISPEGLKIPFSSWDVANDQLRRTWRNGLLSTGFFVVLPWKSPPTSEKLRVVVQFTLSDGRVFESDKDITIRCPPAPPRKAAADCELSRPLPNATEGPSLLPGMPIPLPSPSPGLSGVTPAAAWLKEPLPTAPGPIQLLRPIPLGGAR